MKKLVGVVKQEATMLTSFETGICGVPLRNILLGITKMKCIRNGSKTFLKRLGVSNGFPVYYLNTEA
jgi:hypothetical protein